MQRDGVSLSHCQQPLRETLTNGPERIGLCNRCCTLLLYPGVRGVPWSTWGGARTSVERA